MRIQCLFWMVLAGSTSALAQEQTVEIPPPPPRVESLKIAPSSSAKPLNPAGTVLLDVANKKVILRGELCRRDGLLEMLICKAQTKEHESIIAVDAEAQVIHAALLAIGAQPGSPATFQPDYAPPTGQKLDIWVGWTDDFGRPQRFRAQQLVRHAISRYYTAIIDPVPSELMIDNRGDLRYDTNTKELIWFGRMTESQKTNLLARSSDKTYQAAIESFFSQSQPRELVADFVFAGSRMFKQRDGTNYYMAEEGNLVCVANFGDAMIDISIRSSMDNSGLMFEPYEERLPKKRTSMVVELILVPEEPLVSDEPVKK